MQRLPAELHGRIFVACLPNERYVLPVGSEAPRLLLRVCRQWRSVALGTPELWRSLDAAQDFGMEGLQAVHREHVNFYRTWLSRSGSLPLALGISFSEDSWTGDEWLQAVRGYRERFERLRIVDGAGLDVNMLLEGADKLKHLAIEGRSEEGALTAMPPPLQPCIHTLVLDLHYASPATFLSGGWANLTHLAVRLCEDVSYEVDDFLGLLNRCPNLDKVIFGPISTNSLGVRASPYQRPKLRELTVLFNSSEADHGPVPMLVLPGLVLLRVLHRLEGDLEDLEEALLSDGESERLPLAGRGAPDKQGLVVEILSPERTCRIHVVSGNEAVGMFDLCWGSITQLNLEVGGSTGVFGTALSLCPSLVTLSLYGRSCTSRCMSLATPLSHLTLLFLTIEVWAELGNFLFMATLPRLRELGILAVSYGQPEDVRGFLIRSGCPLEALCVQAKRSRGWTEEEQADLMQMIPTVTQVKLI